MKPILLTVFVITLFPVSTLAQDAYVEGYYRNDGTYVEPHYRSQPDGYSDNNYSTRGNTNPYTDNHGTINPQSIGNGGENDSEPLEYRGRPSSYRRVR